MALATSAKSPKVMAIYIEKVLNREMQTPAKKLMHTQEGMSRMVMSSNPGSDIRFFSHQISVKLYLNNPFDVQFAHFECQRCEMY